MQEFKNKIRIFCGAFIFILSAGIAESRELYTGKWLCIPLIAETFVVNHRADWEKSEFFDSFVSEISFASNFEQSKRLSLKISATIGNDKVLYEIFVFALEISNYTGVILLSSIVTELLDEEKIPIFEAFPNRSFPIEQVDPGFIGFLRFDGRQKGVYNPVSVYWSDAGGYEHHNKLECLRSP